MWGSFVEGELKEAGHKAKNDNQARQKVQMKAKELLTRPDSERLDKSVDEGQKGFKSVPVPAGQFKDPASVFTRKR